jgi:hypothetical protein
MWFALFAGISLSAASSAWACGDWPCPSYSVVGSVVCQDTGAALPDVGVTVTAGAVSVTDTTDGAGEWSFSGSSCAAGSYEVTLDLSSAGGSASYALGPVAMGCADPFTVPAFVVNPPSCAPSGCEALEGFPERYTFCDSTINPNDECQAISPYLTTIYKQDVSGSTTPATTDAAAAIVKAGGGCFTVYIGVTQGDILSKPYKQGISHVSYCACP